MSGGHAYWVNTEHPEREGYWALQVLPADPMPAPWRRVGYIQYIIYWFFNRHSSARGGKT
jgi:hypothetical protein